MHFASSLLIVALAGLAQAQTPGNFTPQVTTKLEVVFNSTMVNTPGQTLSKASTASQPQLAISSARVNSADTYMFVMLDLDVPPAQGNTTRRVLLHALTTGFKATQQQIAGSATLLATPEKGPAAYLAPSPPATDSVPHRYVELLFTQPASFSVQASEFANVQARIGFNVNAFMRQNGLSAPIAANFFQVLGSAGAVASGTGRATGTATGTGGIVRNTLQPFEGAVGRVEISQGLLGVLGGAVLFAL